MKTMLALALVLSLTPLAFADPAATAAAPAFTGPVTDKSRICMMQDSMQPKPGITQEHGGKTYYLCCPMCAQSFVANPDRYARAKDPVDGTMVDKATAPAYAVDGKAYYFSSETTRSTFAKDPSRYLRKDG